MHANEQVIRTALGAFTSGDMDGFSDVISDDIVVHVPGNHQLAGEYKGKDEFLGKFIAKAIELTGGSVQIEAHDFLASDDHAVGVYVMRAERDGRSAEWRHINVYHVGDGKITEVWWNPFDRETVDELFA